VNEFTKDQLELLVELSKDNLINHKNNNRLSMAGLILFKLEDLIKNYCEHISYWEAGSYITCALCRKKW